MKSLNFADIEKSTYAFLLTKYIGQVTDNPRFIILGFSDVRREFKSQFNKIYKDGKFIEPEETGQLKEAFNGREKTIQKCIIAVEHKSLGKYASLLTSFKVLDESIQFSQKKSPLITGSTDIHTPIDVAKWFVKSTKNVKDLSAYIKNKLSSKKQMRFELLKVLLEEITELIKTRASYVEYAHPRKIIRGLVKSISGKPRFSVGFFLREIGVEPIEEMDEIPLFSLPATNKTAEFREKLKKTFRFQASTLRKYVSCKVGKQKKNLADLAMNILRKILYDLARSEIHKNKWKWVDKFYEFETKFGRRRKYVVKSVGTDICERSRISGLPIRIRFVLSRKEKSGKNLLQDFHRNKFDKLLARHATVVGGAQFHLNPVAMLNEDELVMELCLKKDNLTILDPFIEGSKKKTRQINNLLRIVEQQRV